MMKQVIVGMCVGVALGVTPGAGVSESSASEKPEAGDKIMSEDVLIIFADEPQHHYTRALGSFLKRDWKAAADEIRKGADFVKAKGARASADTKQGLIASAQAMENVADDIESGAIRSVKELKAVFAGAEHAVAKQHYLKAVKAWGENNAKEAGIELHAAAASLENAFVWDDQELQAGMVKAMDETRRLAGKMQADVGWAKEGVGKAIEYVGKEIEKLGGTITD